METTKEIKLMELQGRLLEERKLENGLTVYFYDQSRPIVGDRCQVQLLIHVDLEIKESYFEKWLDPASAYEGCIAAFGRQIPFQQQKVRNFINNSDAEAVVQKMKEEFLESGLAYFLKPQFAKNYVIKRYSEWEQETACRIAHNEAIRRAN